MPRSRPERSKSGETRKRAAEPKLSSAFDRSMVEGMMTSILSAEVREETLDRAQELVYDAWEANTARQRTALARKALAITPLCADAYVLLAQHSAPGSEQSLEFYRLGLQAGERALGEAAFEEDIALFWGLIETRPYMRARFGFARELWTRGAHDEAVAHYRELLRLNPDDNQGVRYVLAACYLELGLDAELAALLTEYEEDESAAWLYTQTRVTFRREGDTALSRRQLLEAVESNSHVPAFLLGKCRLPNARPFFMTMGGKDEAIFYMAEYGSGWARTPGALEWLGNHVPHTATPQKDVP
jgi:tetratricopeptide (TPR) repeat protein